VILKPFYLGLSAMMLARGGFAAPAPMPTPVPDFIEAHCANCHDDVTKEGNLDLAALLTQPHSPQTFETWAKVHDRVRAGEMPPKKRDRPDPDALEAFVGTIAQSIISSEQAEVASRGRAVKRRLNRYEYENTVRDLLSLPYLSIRESIPQDPTAHGFNKIGEALDVSHVQMARYLRAAEFSLREAIAPRVARPESTVVRYHTWLQPGFVKTAGPDLRRTFPIVGLELQTNLVAGRNPKTGQNTRPNLQASSQPERREQEAVVMLMSTYEPAEIQFNRFRAPVTGRYRLRFSGYTVWMAPNYKSVSRGRRTEPVTIYSDTSPRLLRKLGGFDFGPDPTTHEIEVWLLAGETIRPDAARLVRSRPPDFKNPNLEADGMPGVAFQWMEAEGPLLESWPSAGHRLLFGDLKITDPSPATKAPAGDRPAPGVRSHVAVQPADPEKDAERLLRNFMKEAYRNPVAESDVARFLDVIRGALKMGFDFTDAMIAGYTGVLASPGFIYFEQEVGKLSGRALAERLSYFLWNTAPDAELRRLADDGSLLRANVLRAQVERLLEHPHARRFVDAFLDYWLDLRKINDSGPDAELYPEYQLDDLLTESLPAETQLFFLELIRKNLGVRTLVASDFAMLNERLATLYALPGVSGNQIRAVPLEPDSVRGGLLTQGSILKVTANGTTTSPVMRGVWVMERLLGKHTPPPPTAVPAVESDIRGATTIREQLEKHRSEEACNVCHRIIDPAGFALENFDVMGAWRGHYRAVGEGAGERVKGVGHDGYVFKFRLGPEVDASGELPDGRTFKDIRDFRKLLLADEPLLARNLAQQLIVYATGAPIRFSDRPQVAAILERSRDSHYSVRQLIHEIVQSEIFLNK